MTLRGFVALSLFEDEGAEGKIDPDARAFHEWLHFGVRARYQF